MGALFSVAIHMATGPQILPVLESALQLNYQRHQNSRAADFVMNLYRTYDVTFAKDFGNCPNIARMGSKIWGLSRNCLFNLIKRKKDFLKMWSTAELQPIFIRQNLGVWFIMVKV